MINILIAFTAMILLIIFKKIPYIGGNMRVGLVLSGIIILISFGVYNPMMWLEAFLTGLDRFMWIIVFTFIILVFAEYQIRLDIINKVMRMLKAIFGTNSRPLLIATFIALTIFGALVGSTNACTMVVSIFVAKTLYDQGLKIEEVGATLVMGAALGSLCPPVSFSFNTASAALGTDLMPILNYGYVIAPIGAVICCIYVVTCFGKDRGLAAAGEGEKREKVGDIAKEIGFTGIPTLLLVVIIILNNGFGIDLIGKTVGSALKPLIGNIRIVNSLTNTMVLTFTVICIFCVIFYSVCRKDSKTIYKAAFDRALPNMSIFVCASFMVGAIIVSGGMDAITAWASALNGHALRWGGAVAMCMMGMFTGSNGTAITTVAPFFGPALLAQGLNITKIGAAIGVLASAGQGMPPADTNTFVVVGMLTALLGIKNINPLKIMLKSWPMWAYLFCVGMLLLYI